jgi:dipeptidyl aminopeptidase/acylaminoacyl peptidase
MHPILSKRFVPALIAGALVLFAVSEPSLASQDGADAVPDEAAAAALIPRRLLFGLPERSDAAINDDGTRVSFRAPVGGAQNLWVAPVDNIDAARPVTKNVGRAIKSSVWSYDPRYILYSRDTGGDENFHIYSLDVDTGATRDLTPFDGVHAVLISGSHLHPDDYLVGINNRDPRWNDVWSVNIRTGERRLIEQHDRFSKLIADWDLKVRLAVESMPGGGQQVYKRDEQGQWVKFFVIDAEASKVSTPLAFTRDGTQFYVLDSTGRDTAALVRVNYRTGTRVTVAEDSSADLAKFVFDPSTHEPLAYRVDYLENRWRAVGRGAQRDLGALAAQLSGSIDIVSQDSENKRWVVAREGPQTPLSYYLFDRDTGRATLLFATRPELNGKPLVDTHPIVIPARDGLKMVSYLTLPPGSRLRADDTLERGLPTVLNVHGGPWYRTLYGFDAWAQWFANRGYAVLNVNFRASKGFGKAYLNAGNRQWGAAMQNDLIDAVDWAIAHHIVQPTKVAILGGSYGGYATLAGLAFTPQKFACGVEEVGPTDLVTLLENLPPYWVWDAEALALRVGDPRTEEGRALLRSRSPLFFADKIARPLLIGVGANDPRVTRTQGDQIVAAMQRNHLPVTYVVFPDEGHWFERTENRIAFNAVSEQFLAACLGGRAEPIGDGLQGSSIQVPVGSEHIFGLDASLKAIAPVLKN